MGRGFEPGGDVALEMKKKFGKRRFSKNKRIGGKAMGNAE